jgi:ADP-heptose:LPS heptosyltransferase
VNLKSQLWLDFYVGGLLHIVLKPFVRALGITLRRDHDLARSPNITVLKLRGAGSLAIAYPALLALSRRPGTKLRLVTSPAVSGFASTLGVFDEIMVIGDHSVATVICDSLKAIVKMFRTDAIVDLEVHSRLTTVFSLMTCARNRVGFYTKESFWRRGLSTHLLFFHVGNGIYHFYDQLAVLFGCPVPSFESCIKEFQQELGSRSSVGSRSKLGPREIGIAPCCSDLSKERMLSVEEWASAIERSEDVNNLAIHGIGGPADRGYIEDLFAMLRQRCPGIVCENHAGRLSPAQSLSLLAGLQELYCVDSALLHYGRLLGVNTTSFWGPTDPRTQLRPSRAASDRTHFAALPCSPCVHLSSEPPCRGNNVCMRMAARGVTGECNPVWLAHPAVSGLALESLIGLHEMVHAESVVQDQEKVNRA